MALRALGQVVPYAQEFSHVRFSDDCWGPCWESPYHILLGGNLCTARVAHDVGLVEGAITMSEDAELAST